MSHELTQDPPYTDFITERPLMFQCVLAGAVDKLFPAVPWKVLGIAEEGKARS